jgi:DNA-binding beta-propeller fold protein YncE
MMQRNGKKWWTRGIPLAGVAVLGLLAFGCGKGSSSGGGSGGGSSTTVTVSPSAAFVPVNGSQAFSATVTGAPTIAIAATNGAVRASNSVTITTTTAHNLAVGQSVAIAGVSDASFNGTFTVSAIPTSTTFTYIQGGIDATSGGGTVANLTVNWLVNDKPGGDTTVGTITSAGVYTAPAALPAATTATITSSGAVRKSNVVTITTAAAHNFVLNQVVIISGVTDTSFNGTFQITGVPSTTTFTYSQSASDVSSGGGTVTSFAVTIKATSVSASTASGTAVVSIDSGLSISVTPVSTTIGTGESFQFTAKITGSLGGGVTWSVNGVAGGNSNFGTISPTGNYTAPAALPSTNTVAIATTAGAVRATNVVTITTVAAHGFTVGQTVTIAGVLDSSFNGSFVITNVPSSSTFIYAQTGANATSGGGTATSASNAVTITATATADPTRSADASAVIVVATDPTLASVSPSIVAQGAVFQDIYLAGTNMISTTTVRVNGAVLPSSANAQSTPTVLRVRLPANLLASPGTLSVDVERQNGAATPPKPVTVVTARPALVGASPESGIQGGAPFSFNLDGGYYGPSTSPVITAEFAGSTRAAAINVANDTRQASVTIGAADLSTAGLFQVGVRNATDTTLFAATNVAIRPSATPSVIGAPIPVGSKPSSIAVNQGTGVAVVSNRCSSTVNRIDVGTLTTVGSAIPVGAFPTGVAVDDLRNIAVVVNNGNPAGCPGSPAAPSLSIVDLAAGAVSSTVTTNVGPSPFSVGVNPLTGLALVAYQNTNHADIVDLTQSPPAIVSTTTISTGANPQVAVNPRLNWAVVTPGGAGTLSIVDLSRRSSAGIAATNGAVRNNGITTITTTAAHPFLQNQVVLITGMTDASFNGIFSINSVPSNTTFTYVQAGVANASSGGGTAVSTPPVAVATVGPNMRGIGINPFTQRAVLTDPTTVNVQFFDLFDQVVKGVTVDAGAVAAAFSPFTDIAVSVNPLTNQAAVIDPQILSQLVTLPVGAGPRAVAIDAGTNTALVVNETDGTVTAIALGAIRSLHLGALSMPASRQLAPGLTLSSATDLPLTILGKGFVGGSVVRLNGVPLPLPSSVTDRQLTVTVPAAFLAAPKLYVVDVQNPGGLLSNVLNLTVVQPVSLVGAGGASCTAPAPAGVGIDPQRDLAVVTNSGCNNASVIDLNTGTITATLAVDANPMGVAVSEGLGSAVVTNNGAGNISIIDLTASPPVLKSNITVGTQPRGVTVNELTGQALVTNAGSASLSQVDLAAGAVLNTITVDSLPWAVAVDPVRGIAAVAHANSNNLAFVDLGTLSIKGRISTQLPTAVVFDPITNQFITNTSLGNQLFSVIPDTLSSTPIRSGINPTSIAYNFASGTLVTVNTASATFSVMDMVDHTIRDVLAIPGSPQFSVDIHPRTNLAVVADQVNNRVLLVPLPR